MNKAREARKTIDQALERLSDELNNGKSDTMQAFLAMLAKFHRYSFGNIMLIHSQRPDSTRVAGYRAWQKLGRQVRKGEKGITIIAPMMVKRDSEPGLDSEKVLRFRAASVFDLSQTDGDELPAPTAIKGTPGNHARRLRRFVRSLGIELRVERTLGGPLGISTGGSILLKRGLSDAQYFAVLVHELALLNGAENYSAKVTDARERLNAIHMPGGVDVESFDALFAEVEPWADEVRGLEPHVEHIAAMLEAKEFEDALNQDPDEGP